MSKTRKQVCKQMVLMSVMVAIESLLIAYQSGGLIRVILAAIMGICTFKTIDKVRDLKNLCIANLCAVVILLTSGKDTLSFAIITFGMLYAGIVGARAYQE